MVSERSRVTGQAFPDLVLHTSVITTALFSSTRVVLERAVLPAVSVRVVTSDAFPGNMTAVPLVSAPAPPPSALVGVI